MAGRRRSRASDDDLRLGTDKLYFKIGEVAQIVGVAPHVLRYWETEFSVIKPQKSRARQRVYRRRDVATLLRIKHLLYVDKFTIAGARKRLRQAEPPLPMAPPATGYLARQSLLRVRAVLDELDALVTSSAALDPAAADPAAYLRQAGSDAGSPTPVAARLARPRRSER